MACVGMYSYSVINARVSAGWWRGLRIPREASALSVQLRWAIPEPLCVGRATVMALTLFLYQSDANAGSPAAHIIDYESFIIQNVRYYENDKTFGDTAAVYRGGV